MLNNVVLIGRIANDIVLKKSSNNLSYVQFRMAVNRSYNTNQADFINCVAWRQSAEFMANYLTKGALISIEGSINSSTYRDKDGKTVYATSVSVNRVQSLESRNKNQAYQVNQNQFNQQEIDKGVNLNDLNLNPNKESENENDIELEDLFKFEN